jgi:alkyldihydroxyacetonephosphate synthase
MTLPAGVRTSAEPLDCRMVAHDLWPRRFIERREQQAPTLPERVFWPESDDEVAAIVRAARAERRPIVPFGAGSGVCGGISPTSRAWIVDLKRMARIVDIDVGRQIVVVEAGLIGERLEEALNARGLTLGHFPSSIYCSTVGGWVATRSAGQLSSRYGKIEDMVVAVEGVDGRGRKIRAAIDDPRTGPGTMQLLVGSEGALAVLTRFTLRVRPLPSHRWLRGYVFEDVNAGLSAMRALLQSGCAPSVLRLYDKTDAALAGHASKHASSEPDRIVAGAIARADNEDSGPGDRIVLSAAGPSGQESDEPSLFDRLAERVDELALFSHPGATRRIIGEVLSRPQLANAVLDRLPAEPRFVVGLEGAPAALQERIGAIKEKIAAHGGRDAGDAPGARWLSHRHRISYRMSRAFAAGSWIDTCEVATGWESVTALHRDVREALFDVAVVLCHFSHAYVDGCSLYFTFAGGGGGGTGPRSALARYDLAWERALTVIRQRGAAIAHHHGVGRSKARALRLEAGGRALLLSLKAALDPDGIMNPGVLGLDPRGVA